MGVTQIANSLNTVIPTSIHSLRQEHRGGCPWHEDSGHFLSCKFFSGCLQ